MTDEEKKEYRDKLVEDCMKYNHIDYDDDKDIVETMVEAIASEELMELIPNFDPYNLTARQRLLVYSFVKEPALLHFLSLHNFRDVAFDDCSIINRLHVKTVTNLDSGHVFLPQTCCLVVHVDGDDISVK